MMRLLAWCEQKAYVGAFETICAPGSSRKLRPSCVPVFKDRLAFLVDEVAFFCLQSQWVDGLRLAPTRQ